MMLFERSRGFSISNGLQAIPPIWAAALTVEKLPLIYRYVTVMDFRLGRDCFAESKSRWVTQELHPELTVFRQTANSRAYTITYVREDLCINMAVIGLWFHLFCGECINLWCSSGSRCIEDVERMVGWKRNTVMRSSSGHLFFPVQRQLRVHWDFLL